MNRLEFDEFLRSVSISKNDTYSLLLGAGSSISSGIPSANDCIWDWKGTIYKSNNSATDCKYRRWSDFYIFCLLDCKDQKTINPMDLSQWTFYVLSTKVLNEKKPTQKTIGLNSLLKLNPVKCAYCELKEAVK